MSDTYNLNRFVTKHQEDYANALSEIQNGKKQSHWMWYIFPQLKGLGKSTMAEYYGMTSLPEAIAFLNHPLLGKNLKEITRALLPQVASAREIFGKPDDRKLHSSMTLFALVDDDSLFQEVLDNFFDGKYDERTLQLLEIR